MVHIAINTRDNKQDLLSLLKEMKDVGFRISDVENIANEIYDEDSGVVILLRTDRRFTYTSSIFYSKDIYCYPLVDYEEGMIIGRFLTIDELANTGTIVPENYMLVEGTTILSHNLNSSIVIEDHHIKVRKVYDGTEEEYIFPSYTLQMKGSK